MIDLPTDLILCEAMYLRLIPRPVERASRRGRSDKLSDAIR